MSHQNSLLLALGPALGIEPWSMDEDGAVAIDFGDDLVIFIASENAADHESSLVMYARIGELPLGQTEVLEELLEANLLGQATNGATLSLERYSRTVLIHWRPAFSVSSTVVDLESIVRSFADTAERWGHVLDRLLQVEHVEDFSNLNRDSVRV
jgi:Tir chaperone protein (CesT) family